jgi:hypothetical protein
MSIIFDIKGLGLFGSFYRFLYFYFVNLNIEIKDSYDKNGLFFLSWKRIFILLLLLLMLPLLLIWNHIGFWLDDILYPSWKFTQVKNPLFIVGNARSGTTWLHRLLSNDIETFTTIHTWEILFAVSVTWRKMFIFLYNIDYNFGGYIMSLILNCEKIFIGHISVHEIGLMKPEEDEWLMSHIFLSQLIMFFFPLSGSILNPLVFYDLEQSSNDVYRVPEITRLQIMGYYKQCIQKHIFARFGNDINNNIIFISKNPAFTMRISSLRHVFPDCRIVVMIRDPVQSIPSMVSYISKVKFDYYI